MTNRAQRVLVAEDNSMLAQVIKFNLERDGFEVTIATNGTIAVEYLKSEPFDLMITDYQMPGVDGGQLCQIVREELKLEKLPILMCTAKGLEISIDQLKANFGVTDVIFKPFSMRTIVGLARAVTELTPVDVPVVMPVDMPVEMSLEMPVEG